ncbi:MAG: methyltransferase domain-containing protein [Bacteroidales bacterium]|nr:methyltransferase domain-containing protein [Bacteroidales bacterium]
MEIKEINSRYSELAESDCCLSCGGAINYAEPMIGEVCVDLGSGRGTDVLRMAESVGETGFVYGIDISDGMLEKARKNAEKFKVKNVRFVRSELEKLDLPDMVANLVISNCTINHAADKQAVWNEIYRILKKGGRFVISDIYSTAQVPDEYRNDPVAIAECWAGSVTRDEYLKQLENVGFTSVSIIEESAPYDKGKIKVASWTIAAKKPSGGCCCSN